MTTASPGSAGISQQGPNDHSNAFNATAFLVKQLQAQVESMMPVQVTAVHPGSGSPPAVGTVDVQLLVSQIDGAGNVAQNGIVYGLPYFRLQGGPWAIIIDPAQNDFGFIIAADRDITSVKANPGIQAPGSPRKYSYSDGIFLSCPFGTTVPAGTFVFKADGTWTLTDQFGNVLNGSSSGITATPVSGGSFAVNGNITATGTIIGGFGGPDQVGLTTHEHPTAATGSPSPPTPGT
jgi:hypothetical protein